MEIEIPLPVRKIQIALLGLAVLLGLAGLGAVGRFVSPLEDGRPRPMSWADWEAWKARRAFRDDIRRLREDAEALAVLLNGDPDPVRAQILAERIFARHREGTPLSAPAREALMAAARAAVRWSVGAADRAEAVRAYEEAAARIPER